MMIRSWLILLVALAPIAFAETARYDRSEIDVDEILIENTTIITGRIRSIDLGEGSAIVSGFKYHFGSSSGIDRSLVKMLHQDFGAVEMLQVNMFVEVYYVQESERRVAKLIIQTEDGDEF
jgi:hypothetical protein